VTLSASAGQFASASLVSVPSIGLPVGSVTPFGWWGFQITGLNQGQNVSVTITFPSVVPPNAHFYKSDCGTTPGAYLADNLISGVNGNTMTISLTDGGAGDCDSVTGQVTDPGGIVMPGNDSLYIQQEHSTWTSSTTAGSGSDQGPPVQSVPEWSSSLVALSLAFVALTLNRKYAIRDPV
jgi:hypothetical protein